MKYKIGNRNLKRVIEIIKIIDSKITNETDVIWAGYDSPDELKNEIRSDLEALIGGDLSRLEKFRIHFAPTSTFQELSMSNGWSNEYLQLAKEFDKNII